MTALLDAPTQEPRVKSVPDAPLSLGDDAVAFAAKAGLDLMPWQQMVLRDALGVSPGGKWASPQVGVLVPRQNGKGSVLEALELFHLFVLNTPLIIHSAHKFDTSQEHFLRMRLLIDGNPDLARHVAATPTANGKEAIILRNGNRLKFKARTISGAGRGFSADLLILDEAMLLPEQALDAMMPTLRARKNPQVWFTSSAGTPDSTALWRIVRMGRQQAKRLAYFEWGCESGVDVNDRNAWLAANPGAPYGRPSLEGLEDDFTLLSEDGFAREHLGIWDDAAAGVFPADAWDAVLDPDSKRAGPVTFAVDVSPDRESSSIAAAGSRPDGVMHVEVVDRRRGVEWVAGRVRELAEKYTGAVVIDPASPAGSLLLADLTGVQVHKVSARDYAQGCADFYDAVVERRLRRLDQPELNVAAAGARKRDLSGGFAWDRKNQSADITPLVAVTLAHWGFRTFGGADVTMSCW